MNHIKKLQNNNQVRQYAINEFKSGIKDLKNYLLSSKFYNDPTVQVKDVLNRLAEIEAYANYPLFDLEQ